jgi:two-component system, LytTR family, response regulator
MMHESHAYALPPPERRPARMRTVIVDDEPLARRAIRLRLLDEPDIEIVGEASDGAEAVAVIKSLRPDLVFLDVRMPHKNGFEVLADVTPACMPIVVFVTAYDRYAVEAFELAAMDYLLKPVRRERLGETITRVLGELREGRRAARTRRMLDMLGSSEMTKSLPTLRRLPVRHRREVKLLDLEQVPIIFSRDRLVLARADSHEYLVDYTLQELEQRLPEGLFVRAHRGALVNLEAIESYGGEDGVLVLKLKDGTRVEASERRAAEVRRKLR